VFDESLDQQCENKNNYKEVLEKKKKFMEHVKKGVLNPEKYRALLIKCISEARKYPSAYEVLRSSSQWNSSCPSSSSSMTTTSTSGSRTSSPVLSLALRTRRKT
jgi:hypothetical protein